MKKKEISRILVLLGLLFAATLLLLALPQKIFEKLDTDLLKESGGAVYELQAVESDMLLFAEKLKLFVDGEPINRIVWGETFPADKLILEEIAIADEMDILLDNKYWSVTSPLENGKLGSRGFAAEVYCEIDEKEYSWTVGLLYFGGDEELLQGIVIYDYDSKKIFYLNISDRSRREDKVRPEDINTAKESVVEYYAGLDVQWIEAAVYLDKDVIIFPGDLGAFEEGELYQSLIKAYLKFFVEGEQQEIYYP